MDLDNGEIAAAGWVYCTAVYLLTGKSVLTIGSSENIREFRFYLSFFLPCILRRVLFISELIYITEKIYCKNGYLLINNFFIINCGIDQRLIKSSFNDSHLERRVIVFIYMYYCFKIKLSSLRFLQM